MGLLRRPPFPDLPPLNISLPQEIPERRGQALLYSYGALHSYIRACTGTRFIVYRI